MISVKNLIFEYPGVLALDNVSMDIGSGDITALVGPNGAGKTTLLRCVAGLETPISGSIQVNQVDVLEEPRLAHSYMGYLPDFFGLYNELTLRQSLTYAALSYDISPQQVPAAVALAAQRLQIDDRLDHKVGTLSRGLAQRLAIAQVIVHEPKLLLLDEPASGLDPEARHTLSRLFLALRDQGMTIVVSSHILAELEEYSNSMVIVRAGKIVEHRRLDQQEQDAVLLRIGVVGPVLNLQTLLTAHAAVSVVEVAAESIVVRISADKAQQQALLQHLVAQQIPVHSFSVEKVNMQDAYLKQIGQQEAAQ